MSQMSVQVFHVVRNSPGHVYSLLKVTSLLPHALEKVFPPTVFHCMLELKLRDVSCCNVHCGFESFHGQKLDPPGAPS